LDGASLAAVAQRRIFIVAFFEPVESPVAARVGASRGHAGAEPPFFDLALRTAAVIGIRVGVIARFTALRQAVTTLGHDSGTGAASFRYTAA
jgi:hypothetical protein